MDEKKIREIARIVCDNYAQNGLCFIDGDICDNVVCKYYKGAKALLEQDYRKESDTAREILKWLVWNKHLFNRTHEIGFEKPRTSYLIMSDEIEELAEKYGVDLGE